MRYYSILSLFPLLRKSVNAIRLSHEALTSAQAVFFQYREARALGSLASTRLNSLNRLGL